MDGKLEQHLPKKTLLRVKRKRNDSIHDVIGNFFFTLDFKIIS